MSRNVILTIATLVLGINSLAVGQVISFGPNGFVVRPGQSEQVRPLPYPMPRPQPQPSPRPQPFPYPQPHPQPDFIPPSNGQYPVYVTPNEVVGVNPVTGGLDTQNRQIDNTAFQHGRNESQHNGTKRWVRRPVYNTHGQQVGYQEGWVWINSYTGQEHGDLSNYTPNGLGGVNQGNQTRSVGGGVHENIQSFGAEQPGTPQSGVHKNHLQYSPAPTPPAKSSGVHRNVQSYSVQGK